MKKVFRLLIWFFHNLHWAMNIYRQEQLNDFFESMNFYEYRRGRTEMQKCKYILFHRYDGAPTDAKKFFFNYYLYRVIRRKSIQICVCIFLIIIISISNIQLNWNISNELVFGILIFVLMIVFIVEMIRLIKNIRNTLKEFKAYAEIFRAQNK